MVLIDSKYKDRCLRICNIIPIGDNEIRYIQLCVTDSEDALEVRQRNQANVGGNADVLKDVDTELGEVIPYSAACMNIGEVSAE